MPSWNIHTAHVERLLAEHEPEALGIGDVNAFLFGNYIPDIYVGHMVPDAAMRIDYRTTHVTPAYMVPIPDADKFWDDYMLRFLPKTDAGLALLLGTWSHLTTDRVYNSRVRIYCAEHRLIANEDLRVRKQGDFSLFGRSLPISAHVQATSELIEAAQAFPPYRILEEDVRRAIEVADGIVQSNNVESAQEGEYRMLSVEWMTDVFDACNERLAVWLETWARLGGRDSSVRAADIRVEAGLPPATSDDPHWMDY